jgi:hypothetical protein
VIGKGTRVSIEERREDKETVERAAADVVVKVIYPPPLPTLSQCSAFVATEAFLNIFAPQSFRVCGNVWFQTYSHGVLNEKI